MWKIARFGRVTGCDPMVKIVTFFLIFIIILAMFGRLKLPRLRNPLRKGLLQAGAKCKSCGRYSLTGEPCPCRKT